MLFWSCVAWLRAAVGWAETAGKGSGRGHQRSFLCVLVESPAENWCGLVICAIKQADRVLTGKQSYVPHYLLGSAVRQWTGMPNLCGNWCPSDFGCQPSSSHCHLEWQQLQSPHHMTEDWRRARGSIQLTHMLSISKRMLRHIHSCDSKRCTLLEHLWGWF